jgi:hypothetical protein
MNGAESAYFALEAREQLGPLVEWDLSKGWKLDAGLARSEKPTCGMTRRDLQGGDVEIRVEERWNLDG